MDFETLDPQEVKSSLKEKFDEVDTVLPNIFDELVKINWTPHPALDGKRVKDPDRPEIFFVWGDGYKCHIPNPTTYNNLFNTWSGVMKLDPDELAQIAPGPPLTSGAILARAKDTAPVFLVTNGKKHHIKNPSVMGYCSFNWNAVVIVPPIMLDAIPTGPVIDAGD